MDIQQIVIIGYLPSAKYQYRSGETIKNVYSTYFGYGAYTAGGFSGGPVLRDSDNYIVGVHTSGSNAGGTSYAVKLTEEMANIILSLL